MGGIFYYMLTFAESVTSVFGLRFPYEQPRYAVVETLPHQVQVRRYEAREAIEATVDARNNPDAPRQAFQLLFNYITGANKGEQKIAMTAPVSMDRESQRIAMTVPVQSAASGPDTFSMRFFLPAAVVQNGPPAPLDPRLHLVNVPAETIAAIRYSGIPTRDAQKQHTDTLLKVLVGSKWRPDGSVFQFNYDPPFAIPFLRRNEMAVRVEPAPG
ncbi:MAG TPA: heme-binding protein [Rhodopila sp.]|nr:heme-binding protein [Rhodopila sp.]